MKIEVGKFYKTRDGRTVGPIRLKSITDAARHWGSDDNLGAYVAAWFEDGSFWPEGHPNKCDETSRLDLISPAYPEQGTLKEIGAKPGDLVEWMGTRGRDRDFVSYKIVSNNLGGWMAESEYGNKPLISDDPWRIISRASETPTSPVRTVTTTRQEIVPGRYGAVSVHALTSGEDDGVWIAFTSKEAAVAETYHACLSRDDLTAAINTLTEIRDALTA